jgi:hypothetical protein
MAGSEKIDGFNTAGSLLKATIPDQELQLPNK